MKKQLKIPRTIAAGKFKDICLALMDKIAASGTEVTILKRGKPIVKVVPLEKENEPSRIFGSLEGTVIYLDDITKPLDEKWDAEEN